jgi:hypothetical protein
MQHDAQKGKAPLSILRAIPLARARGGVNVFRHSGPALRRGEVAQLGQLGFVVLLSGRDAAVNCDFTCTYKRMH